MRHSENESLVAVHLGTLLDHALETSDQDLATVKTEALLVSVLDLKEALESANAQQ